MEINTIINNLNKYLQGDTIVITKENELAILIAVTRILNSIKQGLVTKEEVIGRFKLEKF
jgi:hypothetical protein